MSFTPSFTAGQVLGNTTAIVFSDTSAGSDSNIASRQVFLAQASGAFLVPTGTTTNFIPWALISNPLSVNVLPSDMALLCTVNWLDINGTVLYTATTLYCFTNNGESFLYQLTQNQAAKPVLLLDNNYLSNKYLVRLYIDAANNAISFGSDISAAQNCINAYTDLIANQDYFF